MLFEKPKDVRYVDMAIYIDEHIYTDNFDEEKVFEYLYHLFYILAVKHKYFTTGYDYDDYAVFAATKVYMRLIDKRQFEENSKLPKIKSVLNYVKSMLYPKKIDYLHQTGQEIVDESVCRGDFRHTIYQSTSDCVGVFNSIETHDYLKSLSKIIHGHIDELPIEDKHNFYNSCLLTLLKSVTVSNRNKEYINNAISNGRDYETVLTNVYRDERTNAVTPYHIDDNLYDYLDVICREVVSKLKEDISNIDTPLSDDMMKNILSRSFFDKENCTNYD